MRGEILLAAGRIRAGWASLADTSTLDKPARRPAPMLDEHRLAYLDDQARADRAARFIVLRDHRTPTGPMPGPAAATLLDIRAEVDRAVTAAAEEAHRTITGEPLRAPWAQHTDTRVQAALDVIVRAASGRRLTVPHAAALAALLNPVADRVEAALALVPLTVPLSGIPCPACDYRSLQVRQDSTDPCEWVAECRRPDCYCRGADCPCAALLRARGRRHVWARDEWSTLAALETRREIAS